MLVAVIIIVAMIFIFISTSSNNNKNLNTSDEDSLTEELLLYKYMEDENQEKNGVFSENENFELDEFDREIEAQEDFEEELLDDLYRNDLGEDQLDEYMNEM